MLEFSALTVGLCAKVRVKLNKIAPTRRGAESAELYFKNNLKYSSKDKSKNFANFDIICFTIVIIEDRFIF